MRSPTLPQPGSEAASLHQLEIVDDDELEVVLGLELPCFHPELGGRDAGRVVDEDGASDRTPKASLIRRHSNSSIYPDRTRWESTAASMQSKRWTSCSVDISRLKSAAGAWNREATFRTIDRAKPVFPTPGRPAMMIRSEG